MKLKKLSKENRNSILLSFAIISGLLMIFCLQNITLKNEGINWEEINQSEYINLFFLTNHAPFNYFNGLWLLFAGLFFCCIALILEIPAPSEVIRYLLKKK